MKGHFASLTAEQQAKALAYRGPENHGHPTLTMHREVTTAYSQAEARELCRDGWRALRPHAQAIITGPDRKQHINCLGKINDGFSALMVRDVREDTEMKHSKDHHPHFAGHRHAGIAVGERAKRSGPAPGQTEFSADQEKAMRAGAPGGSFPQDGGAAPSTGGAPPSMGGAAPAAGGMPTGGAPIPPGMDQDGGM